MDQARLSRVAVVLAQEGFAESSDGWVLDETYPWVTIAESDGVLHVNVGEGAPEHIVSTAAGCFDRLVTECGLSRIDPMTRREIPAFEWSRRVEASLRPAGWTGRL